MKVFYTASYSGKKLYQKNYDLILDAIKSTGVELISPELGNYKEILTDTERKGREDEQLHYEAIKKGIEWADVVIIEMSKQDFQLGHEATLAIMNKKPVLCLSIHEDFSTKIKNRFFYGAKYTKYNVKDIIIDFIVRNKKELKSERFNFFLSKSQLRFLQKKGEEKGITASEYLRGLIDNNR